MQKQTLRSVVNNGFVQAYSKLVSLKDIPVEDKLAILDLSDVIEDRQEKFNKLNGELFDKFGIKDVKNLPEDKRGEFFKSQDEILDLEIEIDPIKIGESAMHHFSVLEIKTLRSIVNFNLKEKEKENTDDPK